VIRALALPVATLALAVAGFHSTARPLSAAQRQAVVTAHEWHAGCPVSLADLRVLTVTYHGFDGGTHTGQIVVNRAAVTPLRSAFRRLYELGFPIRHMAFADTYGPAHGFPADGDVTASFECRQASASPCGGLANKGTGTWSEHAYGEAIDLNPVENPYVGCGMTRDNTARSYLDRSNVRRGMVTPAVVAAFRDAGWGWGGSWTGSTKDYMHFSASGH
jgi:hypothetical protein